MNAVNVPNVNFHSSFVNAEEDSDESVERENQLGNRVNFNFASMMKKNMK